MNSTRAAWRTATLATVATVALLLSAAPASAHIEVEADKAQAGATGVTLTFVGEAESTTSGIVSERVVLPAGIAPADVSLAKAPSGWTLTRGADGFTVSGKALKPRQDAKWSVRVKQLPVGSTELAFKTIESYSDGKVSRWIELPAGDGAELKDPAPILKVKAAAATTAPSSAAPSSAAPSSAPASPTSGAESAPASPSAAASVPVDLAAGSSDSGGTGVPILIAVIVVVVAGAAAAWFVLRRRSSRSGSQP